MATDQLALLDGALVRDRSLQAGNVLVEEGDAMKIHPRIETAIIIILTAALVIAIVIILSGAV